MSRLEQYRKEAQSIVESYGELCAGRELHVDLSEFVEITGRAKPQQVRSFNGLVNFINRKYACTIKILSQRTNKK